MIILAIPPFQCTSYKYFIINMIIMMTYNISFYILENKFLTEKTKHITNVFSTVITTLFKVYKAIYLLLELLFKLKKRIFFKSFMNKIWR
jgi:hypothetical protein